VLTEEHVRIPEDTKEFAINMSNIAPLGQLAKRYIDEALAGGDGPAGKDHALDCVDGGRCTASRTRGGCFCTHRQTRALIQARQAAPDVRG
jgi:fructose-1,6-bisphosphatase I